MKRAFHRTGEWAIMTGPAVSGQGPATTTGAAPTPGAQGAAGSFVVGQPQGAPAAGTQGAPAAGGRDGGSRYQQFADQASRMVERYGPERAVDMLMRENADYREDIRQRDEQLAARPALPAGAVVLVGNDATEWQAFRALNTPAATVKTRLDNEAQLAAAEQARTTGTVAQRAATALGWGGAEALGDLAQLKGMQIEMRDTTVTENGQSKVVPMPFARKASDTTGHWTPLKDYVQQHHPAYLPALTVPVQGTNGAGAAGTAGTAGQPGAQGAPAASSGHPAAANGAQGAPAAVVVFGEPAASAGTPAAPADPVARMLAANEAAANAANALRPAITPPR